MPDLETPPEERWDFWQDGAHEPAFNMAMDEALLCTASRRGRPLLRFYAWDRPAVTIGYVQRLAAAPPGLAVARRPTGGGVVYHDHDFTYTVAIPAGHWLSGLDRTRSYDWINRSVREGLSRCRLAASLAAQDIGSHVDRLTMVCFANPTRYDILMDGRKVAGSAQRRTRDGILHQGSVHFGGPLPVRRQVLADAVAEGFRTTLKLILEPYQPPPETVRLAQDLVTSKYATDTWNQRR